MILALDVGRTTGWAVATTHGLIRDSGTIKIAQRGRDPTDAPITVDAIHARRLADAVESLVAEHRPDVLVLEAVYDAQGRRIAARKLLILRGAALAAALRTRPELHVLEAPIRAWQTWAATAIGWRKRTGRDADRHDAEAIAQWAAAIGQRGERR